MSTQWQKSCIEALITSPTAFRLFRAQQRNIRATDQFIGRVWSYASKRSSSKSETAKEYNGVITAMKCLLKGIEDLGLNGEPVHLHEKPESIFDGNVMLKAIRLAVEDRIIENVCSEQSGEFDFYLLNQENSTRDAYVSNRRESKTILFAIYKLLIECSDFLAEGPRKPRLRAITSGRVSNEETEIFKRENTKQIKDFISWLEEKSGIKKSTKKRIKKVKVKQEIRGINIGIEIEYEGVNCQDLEKELLRLGAVSFDSGWDGCSLRGDQDGDRLRENRLRLESWKSLPALYRLLEVMIERGCAITNKSGMHYHVDLRYNNRYRKFTERKKEQINEVQGVSYINLKKIYELETGESFCSYFYSRIKIQKEFTTAEWRMGSQTLNYKKITLQIFAAIHITDAITQSRKPSEDYLRMLAECCVTNDFNLIDKPTLDLS